MSVKLVDTNPIVANRFTGSLVFTSPAGDGTIQAGQMWLLQGSAIPIRGATNCEVKMPFMASPVASVINLDGSLLAYGIADSEGTVSGMVLSLPGFMTATTFTFGIAAPPPPPLKPGIPALAAAVRASWETHVPVADWRTDADRNITYTTVPLWSNGAVAAFLPWTLALTDQASQKIAALCGGSVQKEAPEYGAGYPWSDPFLVGPAPLVNWIYCQDDAGVMFKAEAALVAQAFDGREPETTIPASFRKA